MRYANCIVTVSGTEVKQFRQYTKLPILNWGENISKEFLPENININKDFLGSFGLQPYRRFQHANAPPAKLKNIFVKTLKRGTKI